MEPVRGIWMQRGSAHCDSEKRDDSQSSKSGGRKDHSPDPIVIVQRYGFRAIGALDDAAFVPCAHDSLHMRYAALAVADGITGVG
jgi:hypothetical protein